LLLTSFVHPLTSAPQFDQTSSELKGRTRSDESSGNSEGRSSSGSSETAGGKAGGGLFGALEAAVHNMEKVTGDVALPEFPELDNIGTKVDNKAASSSSGRQGGRDVGDRLEAGADKMSEKVSLLPNRDTQLQHIAVKHMFPVTSAQ
jgi:hypothetical protein